tara:strand:- start:2051 stop:3349 length:1299 start_codon:yes stop_codon:yes gene_type:complete
MIIDAGTGGLTIDTNLFRVNNAADVEMLLQATENGAVELYYDNAKKLETTSYGAFVAGRLSLDDDDKITLGDSMDLQLYHDGSNSFITNSTGIFLQRADDIRLQNAGGSEVMLDAAANGAVNLYYDGVKKFETNASGVVVTGKVDITNGHLYLDDNYAARFGTGEDLLIYHDGSQSIINDSSDELQVRSDQIKLMTASGKNEYYLIGNEDGAVELYYDNSKKFETTSTGVSCPGILQMGTSSSYIDLPDNASLYCGTGDDLRIYHTGTDSRIVNTTGDLKIRSQSLKLETTDAQEYLRCTADGDVKLFYDNVQKLITTSTGVTVSGTVTDSKGNLRSIPQNTQGSAYTLVAADAGKHILAGGNITWSDSVFSAGDAVTIVNNTSGNITITKGTTMYNTADGNNANRTLGTRGMATILWASGTVAYISGSGLT